MKKSAGRKLRRNALFTMKRRDSVDKQNANERRMKRTRKEVGGSEA